MTDKDKDQTAGVEGWRIYTTEEWRLYTQHENGNESEAITIHGQSLSSPRHVIIDGFEYNNITITSKQLSENEYKEYVQDNNGDDIQIQKTIKLDGLQCYKTIKGAYLDD
jgi:hypothetical protein